MQIIFDGGSLSGVPGNIGPVEDGQELSLRICRYEVVVDDNGNEIMKRLLVAKDEIYQIDKEHRAVFKEAKKITVNKNWVLKNHG